MKSSFDHLIYGLRSNFHYQIATTALNNILPSLLKKRLLIFSWEFFWKTLFEVHRAIFWSLHCLTIRCQNWPKYCSYSVGQAPCHFCSRCKISASNFKIVSGCKSHTAVSTFTFPFLSSSHLSLFLPHLLFFCWVALFQWEKFLRKSFLRIVYRIVVQTRRSSHPFFQGPKFFNSLDNKVINSQSLSSFKKKLKIKLLSKYENSS